MDPTPDADSPEHELQGELSTADHGKYRILGEIARGGMGVVLRGQDLELGREVALKLVDKELAGDTRILERFVEEAQVGGQLQHPGIVPVYALGKLADERPFFTMKLVKGRTLSEMLRERASVDTDRVDFLTIFESVCQTMAYAHSKGVIHRDLKPDNIMVGAFGEVQVVDWGLSKVLSREPRPEEQQQPARTVIETVRSTPQTGSKSLVGNVLGTPAYMSKEQARGQVDKLDERTDVFALGAILCEILTGAPPYVADDLGEVLQLASLGEVDDAEARLAGCSAADELKRLALTCLMPAPDARPRSAEPLARAVREHLAGLEERAHRAQLAEAQQRVEVERSRRRTQTTLVAATSLLLLIGGAAGGRWWFEARRRERSAEVARGLDEVAVQVQELQRAGEFSRALQAAQGATRLVEASEKEPNLLARAQQLVASATQLLEVERVCAASEGRELRLRADLERMAHRRFDAEEVASAVEISREYQEAFEAFGIVLSDPALGTVIEPLRFTDLGIEIALGFDGWAAVLRQMRADGAIGEWEDEMEMLTGLGLDLDPDAQRARVRQALLAEDVALLLELVDSPELEDAPPETMLVLGEALSELQREDVARVVLARGAERHPDSFALLMRAGLAHSAARSHGNAAALFRAALALRPDDGILQAYLGDRLRDTGDWVGAMGPAAEALRLLPDYSWNHAVLSFAAAVSGRPEEAIRILEQGLLRHPGDLTLLWERDANRVALGELSLEALQQQLAGTPPPQRIYEWMDVAAFCVLIPPPGRAYDAERALEILEPFLGAPRDENLFHLCLLAAHVLREDGEAALRHLPAARMQQGEDRHYGAGLHLFAAAAHRLEGDDVEADLSLARARQLREQLVAGRWDDWSASRMTRVFQQFEPIAAGR